MPGGDDTVTVVVAELPGLIVAEVGLIEIEKMEAGG